MANTVRLPRAAKTLSDQVSSLKARTKVERYGEPDGFNVVRSIIFNKATSTWLAPVLDIIEDRRIAALRVRADGRLIVTFVSSPAADSTEPFPLEKVNRILQG